MKLSEIRSYIEEVGVDAGFEPVRDQSGTGYGNEGRVFVMPLDQLSSNRDGLRFTVVYACSIRYLDEDRVELLWAALNVKRLRPVDVLFEYDSVPIPGRRMPPADLARITLLTAYTLDPVSYTHLMLPTTPYV